MIAHSDIINRIRQFNWLTFFAILCVAVSSGFIMFMATKLTNTLASPDWCARAMKAEQLSGTRNSSSCIDLLTIQVKSLAVDNHIYSVTLAVCLAVLVVVVLAKARLDLEASKAGGKISVGSEPKSPVAAAAEAVAGAANDKAQEIKDDPAAEPHVGPAMEEPKP